MVGYRVQRLETIESSYKCPHCLLLLRDPVQLSECAHRLCLSCVADQQGDLITCAQCHRTTPRDSLQLDRGCRNDMQLLIIFCTLCHWTGLLKNYKDHLDQTHPDPICEFCREPFTSVNDLDSHMIYNCRQITVHCPLKPFGCEEKIPRISLNKHFLTEHHQIILIKTILQLNSKVSIRADNRSGMDLVSIALQSTYPIEQLDETIAILSTSVETIKNDEQRIQNECNQHHNTLTMTLQDYPNLKKSVEEQNIFLNGMTINQKNLQDEISSMQQIIDNMKLSAHDGTLIWKITNITQKIEAAKSETQTSIYSQPFYSSPTGYKMCLRLYLDGDGSARRTHISLFFVLMRGEYDPILKFPFCFKMIFCLYDQTDKQQHIIDAFRPDVRSNSFQRPRTDMNIASGIPKFVPLTIFQQENNPYIRDDTIFIQAMVDFADIPKAVLPYVLNISPALTTEIQQAMIRQEIERQQREQSANSSTTYTETNESMTLDK